VKFKTGLDNSWQLYKDNPDNERILKFAELWAELMEVCVEQLGLTVAKSAWATCCKARRKKHISNYEMYQSIALMRQHWVYGQDLSYWQRGKPADKARRKQILLARKEQNMERAEHKRTQDLIAECDRLLELAGGRNV
jgi:hypothetical protein